MPAFHLFPVLLAAAAASSVSAQATNTATYPVKSINLEAAMAPEFFSTATLSQWSSAFGRVADPHAVHGIATSDGGYVLVGKAAEREGSAKVEGFARSKGVRSSSVPPATTSGAGSPASPTPTTC